jgi:hypothetical protein
MPAEEGLWPRDQGRPGRAGQDPAEGGQGQPIGGLPARAPGLTLQHAELVAKSEDLGVETGLGASPDDDSVKQ